MLILYGSANKGMLHMNISKRPYTNKYIRVRFRQRNYLVRVRKNIMISVKIRAVKVNTKIMS